MHRQEEVLIWVPLTPVDNAFQWNLLQAASLVHSTSIYEES